MNTKCDILSSLIKNPKIEDFRPKNLKVSFLLYGKNSKALKKALKNLKKN